MIVDRFVTLVATLRSLILGVWTATRWVDVIELVPQHFIFLVLWQIDFDAISSIRHVPDQLVSFYLGSARVVGLSVCRAIEIGLLLFAFFFRLFFIIVVTIRLWLILLVTEAILNTLVKSHLFVRGLLDTCRYLSAIVKDCKASLSNVASMSGVTAISIKAVADFTHASSLATQYNAWHALAPI